MSNPLDALEELNCVLQAKELFRVYVRESEPSAFFQVEANYVPSVFQADVELEEQRAYGWTREVKKANLPILLDDVPRGEIDCEAAVPVAELLHSCT